MPLGRLALALCVLAAGLVSGACGAPEGDRTGSTSESAFTVSNGDRFVVSATPERIVLSKNVDGVAFPFDESSLVGKAILIHPVDRRATGGVYARALAVEEQDEKLVVTSKALTLGEMEQITEDEIVRIYIDPKRSQAKEPTLVTSDRAQPLTFGGSIGFSRPVTLAPGVTFSHEIDKASLLPEVLVDWTKKEGLELGLRASLGWKSKLTIGGRAGGEFFRSVSVDSPPFVVIVPIGPAPVPVTFSASAFVTCSALVTGPIAVEVDFAADARVGGSFKVRPSLSAPSTWVHEGSWKPEATGTASVTASPLVQGGVTVACAIPRIELKALLASSAGAYIAITPVVSLSGPSPELSVSLAAGVQATLLGVSGGAELTLLTWKP